MEQYDSLFPEAQRRINTGEEGAAAVLFGRLSEYLGSAAGTAKNEGGSISRQTAARD